MEVISNNDVVLFSNPYNLYSLLLVFEYFDYETLCITRFVCKIFQNLSDRQKIWKDSRTFRTVFCCLLPCLSIDNLLIVRQTCKRVKRFSDSQQYWTKWRKNRIAKIANKRVDRLASNMVKIRGLRKANIKADTHLYKAIDPFYKKTKKNYQECLEMVNAMSKMEKQKYYKLQERNKNAVSVDELVTRIRRE